MEKIVMHQHHRSRFAYEQVFSLSALCGLMQREWLSCKQPTGKLHLFYLVDSEHCRSDLQALPVSRSELVFFVTRRRSIRERSALLVRDICLEPILRRNDVVKVWWKLLGKAIF